jgi:hypothetical protein
MESGILITKDYENFIVKSNILFRGAAAAGRALPGDSVVWFAEKGECALTVRIQHIVVGTLELNSKTRYGMTARGTPLFLFQPYDESYPPFYVGSTEKDLTRPQLAVVRFESWEIGSKCPRGVLARALLGPAGELETEKRGLLLHWAGAEGAGQKNFEIVLPASAAACTHQPYTVSIDPPGCRDVDDAISVSRTGVGWEIIITIANVGRVVEANPWLLDHAKRRGQTFYDDGRPVAPMLPVALSEGVCSLLEGKDRLGISLIVSWNVETGERTFRFAEMTVRVDRNHNYESIMGDSQFSGDTLTAFFGCRHDSHEWVERAMILYNVEFARVLNGEGILRRHSAPDQERLERFSFLGNDLKFLAYSSAEYCLAGGGDIRHWGLGADSYCHSSSPIRRFADLYNQLVFLKSDLLASSQAEVLIPVLNKQQKAAKAFERDCRFVEFVLGRTGGWSGDLELILLPRVADDSVTGASSSRVELWVPAWGQIVKQDATHFEGVVPGEKILGRLYADPTKRSWRRRVIIVPASGVAGQLLRR